MIYILILFSIYLFPQHLIETKEYTYHVLEQENEIDLSKVIKNIRGDYKIEIIQIYNEKYEKNKEVIFEICELQIVINTNQKNKPVNISKCNDVYDLDETINVNSDNYILHINKDKFKYLSFSIVFWITGRFDNVKNKKYNKVNNGILREWHKNNRLHIEYKFTRGIKNGIQKRWYADGQQEILYYYENGKLQGNQKSWHSNGNIKGDWNYLNDILHGENKEWYSNGQLKSNKIYREGALISVVESYDINGNTN